MVVEHYLGVVRGEDLSASHVLVLLYVRVHVYHLPISFVSEQQACLATARVHLEVGAVVGGTDSGLPVVVAQICGFGDEFGLALEYGPKILCFQTVSIVDVPRYLLLFAGDLDPQEDDGEPPPVQHFFLPLGQEVEEGVGKSFGSGGCK